MLAKLICFFKGHRRGRFQSLIHETGSTRVIGRMFICPRCESTWTRKGKA